MRAVRIGKAVRTMRAVRAVKVMRAEKAGRDRLWVEYFSGFWRVIRCLYFGDCSVILRSS